MTVAVNSPFAFDVTGSTDLLAAGHRQATAFLNQEVRMILADRFGIRRFLAYVGDISGMSTLVFRQLYAQLGYGLTMETVAEGGSTTAVNITTDVRDITVGQKMLEANEYWLARITGRAQYDWSLDTIAQTAAESYEATFTDDFCTAVATGSNTVGTSASDMTMDDAYDATYFHDLQDGQEGPLLGVLHGRQFADLKESKRGELAEWIKGPDQVSYVGTSYQGEMIGVQWYKCNSIYSDGTDRYGGVFGPGAFAYTTARTGLSRIPGLTSNAIIIADPGIVIDYSPTHNTAYSSLFLYALWGIAIGAQGQKELVVVKTDA